MNLFYDLFVHGLQPFMQMPDTPLNCIQRSMTEDILMSLQNSFTGHNEAITHQIVERFASKTEEAKSRFTSLLTQFFHDVNGQIFTLVTTDESVPLVQHLLHPHLTQYFFLRHELRFRFWNTTTVVSFCPVCHSGTSFCKCKGISLFDTPNDATFERFSELVGAVVSLRFCQKMFTSPYSSLFRHADLHNAFSLLRLPIIEKTMFWKIAHAANGFRASCTVNELKTVFAHTTPAPTPAPTPATTPTATAATAATASTPIIRGLFPLIDHRIEYTDPLRVPTSYGLYHRTMTLLHESLPAYFDHHIAIMNSLIYVSLYPVYVCYRILMGRTYTRNVFLTFFHDIECIIGTIMEEEAASIYRSVYTRTMIRHTIRHHIVPLSFDPIMEKEFVVSSDEYVL